MNQQIVRGKLLWNASDKLAVTFSGDWQHQNQSSTPVTTLRVFPTTGLFSGIYHFCISNPASLLNTITPDDPRVAAAIPGFPQLGQTAPIFNTTNGLCGPRASGTGFGPGGAARRSAVPAMLAARAAASPSPAPRGSTGTKTRSTPATATPPTRTV